MAGFLGIDDPKHVAILMAALNDYCQAAGIPRECPERVEAARLLVAAFKSGARTPDELRATLKAEPKAVGTAPPQQLPAKSNPPPTRAAAPGSFVQLWLPIVLDGLELSVLKQEGPATDLAIEILFEVAPPSEWLLTGGTGDERIVFNRGRYRHAEQYRSRCIEVGRSSAPVTSPNPLESRETTDRVCQR